MLPVPEKFVKKTHDFINFQKYHPPELPMHEEPEQFYANQLWSDESEGNFENDGQQGRKSWIEDESEEQESEEDEDDLLRKIYKQKLNQK